MEVSAARAAATIVLVRAAVASDAIERIEVLVLRRSAGSRFAPGCVVFPGGSNDAGDEELAERWFGTRSEAARACALRELAEEAGLLLTPDGTREAREPPRAMWSTFEAPAFERLPEIGHWIAPEFLPTRFDARFFAAAVVGDPSPQADEREADAAWWAQPRDLLDGQREGTVQLAWPTFVTLEALATCHTVAEALALRVAQVPPPVRSHVAPRPESA